MQHYDFALCGFTYINNDHIKKIVLLCYAIKLYGEKITKKQIFHSKTQGMQTLGSGVLKTWWTHF